MRKDVVGYCDPLTCRPGDHVRFMVSCARELPYDVDIVRLICADGFPDGAGFEERLVEAGVARALTGRTQHTAIGSCAIADHPTLVADRPALTLAAIIRPTAPGPGWQAILGSWDETNRAGFALGLALDGRPVLRIGDGQGNQVNVATDHAVEIDRWSFVAAAVDQIRNELRVWHLPLGTETDRMFRPAGRGRTALGIRPVPARQFLFAAAAASGGRTTAHFNGRIEAPRLLADALGEDDSELLVGAAIPAALQGAVVGWWDFARAVGTRELPDISDTAAHARAINLPNRAVPGHRWTGEHHDWRTAPEHYAAVHFHADDLYDAGWHSDLAWRVPAGFPSGVYAARLEANGEREHVPFFVMPAKGRATADVAFLASTATYLAYANIRTLLARDPPFGIRTTNEAALAAHPEFGHSTYDRHVDGSGVHYSSPHRPILNLKPNSWRWGFCADMNIVAWLVRNGHAHDIITDDALHAEGADLLSRYRVVVTGTHPEYHSSAMLDALHSYVGAGGRLMYLGGNGFYWRIAYSDAWPGAIEVRRAEGGTRPWIAEPGEYHHAFDGEMGGLWRRLGRPPNRLVGVGFSGQGFPKSTYYRRTAAADEPRAAFIVAGVEGEIIGNFGANGDGAAGEELDRFDHHLGSPGHALIVAASEALPGNVLRTIEEVTTTNSLFHRGELRSDPEVRADMVFFETPDGGAVFSTGSIAWAGSLAHNGYVNAVAHISDNVLRHFRSESSDLNQVKIERPSW